MKNVTELRNELAQVFTELKSGQINPKEAAELNNTAGKMIASAKVELEYHHLRGEKPRIDFLET